MTKTDKIKDINREKTLAQVRQTLSKTSRGLS